MHKFVLIVVFFALMIAQHPNSPCPRNQPVMVYHEKEDKIFIFSGYCAKDKTRHHDFWSYDKHGWTLIKRDQAPEGRSGHTMIYDQHNHYILLFGGKNNEGNLLNDVWIWSENSWKQIKAHGPEPRQSHRMVFHKELKGAFLFGGSNSKKIGLNDSWILKNETWEKITSKENPAARLQHTLAYDEIRNTIVLFGGFNRTEEGKKVFGDTWEWNTKNGWQLKNDNLNIARDHHAMAYDDHLKSVVLFGGYHNKSYFGDTRQWNGKEWKLVSENGPARAGKPALFFHNTNNGLVLFGGGNSQNMHLMDFWTFDVNENTWVQMSGD